jgi:hypothetical protein
MLLLLLLAASAALRQLGADEMSCRHAANQSRHALSRIINGFVQPPRRMQCAEPVAVGSFCYDRASHTELRVSAWNCTDGRCMAVFDCGALIDERVWQGLGLTLLVVFALVAAIVFAERRATAARLEALRNKLR